MTRVALVAGLLIAFVAGLGIGAYWGFEEGARIARDFIVPLKSSQAGLYALAQYFNADDQAAEDALQEYLAVLEEQHSQLPSETSEKAYNFETMTTLIRLGNVRLRSGDQEAARAYFERALARCAQAGESDCSEERVRKLVERVDKSTIFYDKTADKEEATPHITAQ